MMEKALGVFAILMVAGAALAVSTNLNYEVGDINAAIGYGLANSNTPSRLTTIENNLPDESAAKAEIGFPDTVFSNNFQTASTTNYATLDLSTIIGTNGALVLVELRDCGSGYFRARHPDASAHAASGAGVASLVSGERGLVLCTASTNGHIEASSTTPVTVVVQAFVKGAE